VAAIDRTRLEGQPSTVKHVEIVTLKTSRQVTRDASGVFEAVGLLRVDLPEPWARKVELSVDGGPFELAPALRFSRPGLYAIRARRQGSSATSELKVRLLGVRGTLELPRRIAPDSRTVKLRLSDERGRAAAVPGLEVVAVPGGPLQLHAERAGIYRGELPLPGGASTMEVAATWAGGELERRSVQLEVSRAPAPAPAPVAPPIPPRPPEGVVALEWGHPALGVPAQSARPSTYLGLSAFVSGPRPAGDPGAPDPVVLRLALRGGLSLMRGRIGMEADLPWFDSDLAVDGGGRSELGDLRLGGRFVALARPSWTVTPALRLTLPTGGFPREHRRPLLEPAVIGEWRYRDRLTLCANLALPIQAGSDAAGLFQYTSLGAGLRLWRALTLSAELDLQLRLRDAGDLGRAAGLAAGGALAWQGSLVRAGVAAGAGLNADGQELYGRFSAGLFVELGLDRP
jgi:hypothetical protein